MVIKHFKSSAELAAVEALAAWQRWPVEIAVGETAAVLRFTQGHPGVVMLSDDGQEKLAEGFLEILEYFRSRGEWLC